MSLCYKLTAMTSGNKLQRAENNPPLTEFDFRYYGWRVVLAACLGVMAGFGSLRYVASPNARALDAVPADPVATPS